MSETEMIRYAYNSSWLQRVLLEAYQCSNISPCCICHLRVTHQYSRLTSTNTSEKTVHHRAHRRQLRNIPQASRKTLQLDFPTEIIFISTKHTRDYKLFANTYTILTTTKLNSRFSLTYMKPNQYYLRLCMLKITHIGIYKNISSECLR